MSDTIAQDEWRHCFRNWLEHNFASIDRHHMRAIRREAALERALAAVQRRITALEAEHISESDAYRMAAQCIAPIEKLVEPHKLQSVADKIVAAILKGRMNQLTTSERLCP